MPQVLVRLDQAVMVLVHTDQPIADPSDHETLLDVVLCSRSEWEASLRGQFIDLAAVKTHALAGSPVHLTLSTVDEVDPEEPIVDARELDELIARYKVVVSVVDWETLRDAAHGDPFALSIVLLRGTPTRGRHLDEFWTGLLTGSHVRLVREAIRKSATLRSDDDPRNILFGPAIWRLTSNEMVLTDKELLSILHRSEISFQRERELLSESRDLAGPKRQPIPDEVKRFVWRRDEGKCVRCSSNCSLEFDHIIPLAKGGSSTARNLQLLCELCNRQKRDDI